MIPMFSLCFFDFKKTEKEKDKVSRRLCDLEIKVEKLERKNECGGHI